MYEQLPALLEVVLERYPQLTVDSVRVERTGQRSDVLVINEAVVFRFPKTAAGVTALAAETAVLDAIHGCLPLPTPRVSYKSASADFRRAFIGYPYLPGEPLWPDTLFKQDEDTRHALLSQLAGFLLALHSVPPNTVADDLRLQDGREHWESFYLRVRDGLFGFMSGEGKRAVQQHFECLLGDPAFFDYHPALRHGDFGPGNILFDQESRRLTGIIDFGSAGLGDPAVDIAALISPAAYGEGALSPLSSSYSDLQRLLERARFYVGTFALQEALWGLEHLDRDAFESGISPYR